MSGTSSKQLTDYPSNLKEAIDWILRVTGKDGQGNNQGAITALTNAVKKLLSEVEGSASGTDVDIQKVVTALTKDNGDLITKLAEGLQQFIGYENKKSGLIRLSGVGRANDPVERLRDAVLGFWLGALMQVSRLLNGKKTEGEKKKVDDVVGKIYKGFGRGSSGVNGVADSVNNLNVTGNGQKVDGVTDILTALKADINEMKNNLNSENLGTLGGAVETYLKAVLGNVKGDAESASSEVTSLESKLPAVVSHLQKQTEEKPIDIGYNGNGIGTQLDAIDGSKGAIKQLGNKLTSLSGKHKNIVNSFYFACAYFSDVLKTGYTSSYPSSAKWTGSDNDATYAQIFLGCLPLIFNNLSYFYWKFSSNGGWRETTLGSPEPKAFMNIKTDKSRLFNGNKKGNEILSALQKFNEFNSAKKPATSYADFLRNFKNKSLSTWQNSKSSSENTFLSGLYLCSTSYFRHQHQMKAAKARPPSSIREMLYWLIGLTATPQFGDLLGHIHNVVGSYFKVAVSGSSRNDDTLTADQVTSYILATCYTAPSVLDIIQGRVPPNGSKNEPWLHRLYSNAEFNFNYPSSGAALFYALAVYTYALQFQLSFLYKQCQDMYINTCGWFYCRYGSDILPKSPGNAVTSHLCEGFKCKDILKCEHNGSGPNSTGCKHDQSRPGDQCGKGSNNSPLQAFLIDKLNGLCRKHPGTSSHLATCSGSTCHVPMGFADNLRESSRQKVQGGHILNALKPFCGSHNTPLRQLCGTLTCLSKRAPRSLGDLFGFYWQVAGQLFNTLKNQDKEPTLDTALPDLLQRLSTVQSNLLYGSLANTVKVIGRHFFGLSWHCHKKTGWQTVKRSGANGYCDDHSNSKKACDLMSLYDSECPKSTCGKYLESLGISSGATFANNYAFTYLSWATYLTDELYESLHEFLDTLNAHPCKNCKHDCSNGHSGSNCKCPSVVDCADVLPHLYANGFNFKDAFTLKGMTWEGSSSNKYTQTAAYKRTCAQFHSQLQSVISVNPLSNLLTSIDAFLYAIRWEFFSKLYAFWTIYICLILYTLFFLLDTLRIRSRLKLGTSHTVPPLALLTSGKSLPVTKLTYIGQ
ncbi:variant erythrocyte surface antigen-1 family protein [Babesia caballi]|uniref:Variant erythrocyte surface antigen-1 family protein n=1 Tax=Babesia caballi TaxID=5871 RepID=A0AAV4LLV9_BABCB|nr:variant erythrocyte surface antigen-1 family protein [Babesia caballi]